MIRVAALQFASTINVDDNLGTCLRMIDRAAEQSPQLMVLPEFCNHLSWYDDQAHADRVAVTPRGEFLSEIAHRAQKHGCYIVVNVSLARDEGKPTVTSLMFDDAGELVAEADKQTLMGHENEFFQRAARSSHVVQAPFAKLGVYPCRDGVTMETPRCLALSGAQILCNSLNSFALDEASLHVPARATDNHVFVVAANKVGPLIPEEMLEAASEATHIPQRFLYGAGESQIIAPDGTILARAEPEGEAVIVADIEPADADDKRRPDGTDIFGVRRTNLYRPITARPRPRRNEEPASKLRTAVWHGTDAVGQDALDDASVAIDQAIDADIDLIVLPELFYLEDAQVDDPEDAAAWFTPAVRQLSEACAGHSIQVVASLVEGVGERLMHMGVLVGQAGIIARQPQLHVPNRHGWAWEGKRIDTFKLPWGRLAIAVGEDACVPEYARVAALSGAHVLACPTDFQQGWEYDLGLRSRSAENRLCIAAASRPSRAGQAVLLDLEREFTLMEPWERREFDGNISYPVVLEPEGDETLTMAVLHPSAADNKEMSRDTDLLDGRPWRLCTELVRRPRRSKRPDGADGTDQGTDQDADQAEDEIEVEEDLERSGERDIPATAAADAEQDTEETEPADSESSLDAVAERPEQEKSGTPRPEATPSDDT